MSDQYPIPYTVKIEEAMGCWIISNEPKGYGSEFSFSADEDGVAIDAEGEYFVRMSPQQWERLVKWVEERLP